MPNTYTQLYIQIVFAVKGRQNLVSEEIREKVEKYICGIVSKNKAKPLAIYCNPDHLHLFIGLNPAVSISDLVRDIKANSSRWINEHQWISKQFRWQNGYGAFSYSKSAIDNVVKYIHNQPNHHRKKSFKDEYISLLKTYEINFDERYLFEWYTEEK
ncbi:MAG: IS200/IS605 family transposase [Flavobacteriales bacterium]